MVGKIWDINQMIPQGRICFLKYMTQQLDFLGIRFTQSIILSSQGFKKEYFRVTFYNEVI